MLAAISTTILSRRSCALTGSAITSRSLRNSTRGPPSAPRMARGPSGVVRTGAKPLCAPASFKEEFAWVPDHGECPSAYIECGMQTASQRQSYDHYASCGFCALQRDPAKNIGRLRRGLIESVERMQRAD